MMHIASPSARSAPPADTQDAAACALPANVEAEKAVLALYLANPETGPEMAARGFRLEWLHLPAHRVLWAAIEDHRRRLPDREVDVVALLSGLIATPGALAEIGGPAALTELLNYPAVWSEAIADYYATLLRGAFQKREALRLVERIQRAIETGDDPAGHLREAGLLADAAAAAGSRDGESWTIGQLLAKPPDPGETLLGDRFLCRTGAMLFVGPSGIGKSSASMHQDISWACGREAFGIVPARPLKILVIQAENDQGDLHEMAAGAVSALDLTEDEERQIEENFAVIRHQTSVGLNFIAWLASQVERHRPDLIRLDPLLAYLGADPSDTEAIAEFCRTGLNPLLAKYGCAVVVNHHTPKTNHRDTSTWKPSDWMYAGGGAADLTNWARAILVVDSTQDPGTFRFIAAKRGRRIGWLDANGSPTQERFFSHAKEHGKIAWSDTPPDVVQAVTPSKAGANLPTAEEFIDLLPRPEIDNPSAAMLSMAELELRAKAKRFSKNGLAGLRDQLRREGKIFVTQGAGRARPVLVGRAEIEGLLKLKTASTPTDSSDAPHAPHAPHAPPRSPRGPSHDAPHAPHAPFRGLGRERAIVRGKEKPITTLGTVSATTAQND